MGCYLSTQVPDRVGLERLLCCGCDVGLSYGCKSTLVRISTQQKRNDRRRKAMCLVSACCPVDTRVARPWDVMRSACGACVRSKGEARAAEIVRTRSKCVTACTAQATTARPRPPLVRPAAQLVRPAKSDLTEHQTGACGTLRLSRPCKLLRLSRLAITMHNVRHMEWVFTL